MFEVIMKVQEGKNGSKRLKNSMSMFEFICVIVLTIA